MLKNNLIERVAILGIITYLIIMTIGVSDDIKDVNTYINAVAKVQGEDIDAIKRVAHSAQQDVKMVADVAGVNLTSNPKEK